MGEPMVKEALECLQVRDRQLALVAQGALAFPGGLVLLRKFLRKQALDVKNLNRKS